MIWFDSHKPIFSLLSYKSMMVNTGSVLKTRFSASMQMILRINLI